MVHNCPIFHIDAFAQAIGVTRDWINRNWFRSSYPPPHFRDGDAVFFEVTTFHQWAKRRALGLDYPEMRHDPTA